MENLSKKVDSVRVECSKKLTESESTHSGHTKTLEDNYVQLVDTLNTKLQVQFFLNAVLCYHFFFRVK